MGGRERPRAPIRLQAWLTHRICTKAFASWNTSQGRTRGVVVRKAVRRFKIDAFEIRATKDDPRWVVQSEMTGRRAAHKASGLRLLKPH